MPGRKMLLLALAVGLGVLAAGLALTQTEPGRGAYRAVASALGLATDDPAAEQSRGMTLLSQGRYADALNAFDAVIKMKPYDYVAWYNRGETLARQERYDEALKSFDEAISLKPDYPTAQMVKGNLLLKLGRNEEAFAAFDKAVADADEVDPGAWYSRGLGLVSLGRTEEALRSFDEALKLLPSYADALAAKGVALAKMGQREESKLLLCQAWGLRDQLADRGSQVEQSLRAQGMGPEDCGSVSGR